MNAFINNDEYVIIFDEEIIDDLKLLNDELKKVPANIKSVLFDMKYLKYVNSIFVDYLIKFNSILEKNNIKLKLINCSDNINALITKSYQDQQIDITLKDI